MNDNFQTLSDAIFDRATEINSVLAFAAVILILAGTAKCMSKNDIEIPGLKIQVRLSLLQFVILVLTFAHAYVALSFVSVVNQALVNLNLSEGQRIFKMLGQKGPLIFKGVISRLDTFDTPFGRAFVMSLFDPSTWLALGGALTALLIMLRWRDLPWRSRFTYLSGSIFLVVTNWSIGSAWAVRASCLNVAGANPLPSACQHFF